jgi:hypothetical protein
VKSKSNYSIDEELKAMKIPKEKHELDEYYCNKLN